MTTLAQLSGTQANEAVSVNELFKAVSAAGMFGVNYETTVALTLGVYGGRWWNGTTFADIANQTVALTASTTNYIETTEAGVVSKNVTAFTAGQVPLYTALTSTTGITTLTDYRQAIRPAVRAQVQNSQSVAYGILLTDAGKHILHPSADTSARTWTIPANSAVAFPIGTEITFVNQNAGGVVTIAITTDTMRLAGAGTTGSRTLAANGIAVALKLTATEWIIYDIAGLT